MDLMEGKKKKSVFLISTYELTKLISIFNIIDQKFSQTNIISPIVEKWFLSKRILFFGSYFTNRLYKKNMTNFNIFGFLFNYINKI